MTEGRSWTLIARVSNRDGKQWTWGSGWWKYNMTDAKGETTDPLDDWDMISPAFWLVGGNEFMITRSDDPHTAPLLQTTDYCLNEQTFRDKIRTSKAGKGRNKCGSNCNVIYRGKYEQTEGFEQANENGCSPANLQTGNKIGFWCKHRSTRAVMMIGAGGNGCSGADHGIGIGMQYDDYDDDDDDDDDYDDFGKKADESPTEKYSLNLWVR